MNLQHRADRALPGHQFHHEDERDGDSSLRRIIRARGGFRGHEDGLRSHHLSHALILWRVSPFAVVRFSEKWCIDKQGNLFQAKGSL